MRTVLGIDAGGTYTDCVIVDAETRRVLHKAKTLTTRHDLTECLQASFDALPADLVADIGLVCLSTTLATNAIVEGHGCKEGLILIGNKPAGRLPTPRHVLVRGRYDIKGRQVEAIDPDQVLEVVESFRHKVDAIAVSGYASVRCPEHELFVKAVIEDRLGIPVACAHELTSKLGYYDRTVTAVLNAKLIPMVCDLMDSVRAVMAAKGVAAPLMMVRGDGTLMAEGRARSKPIETILSGPAASAIGAVHLSGRDDCFVLDIGGTTTDVAHVTRGRTSVRADGARVGGWSTQVRAAEVFTVGLGGDSRIYLDGERHLRIGPERSVSFAAAASRHPALVDELEDILATGAHQAFLQPEQEAYMLVRKFDRLTYTSEENILIEVLRYAPHTLAYLNRTIAIPGLRAILAEMMRYGVVERISLTPTDVWHVTGDYAPADAAASRLALRIAADQLDLGSGDLVEHIQGELRTLLQLSAARAAMYVDRQPSDLGDGGAADYFLNDLYFRPSSTVLRATYRLLKPVVGIGAPAATWLGRADDRGPSLFDAEVPEHADVANAIGAAIAHAIEKIEILIRQDTVSGLFLIFSPQGRATRTTLEDATQEAVRSGEDFIADLTGSRDFDLETQVDDFAITSLSRDRSLFVERVISLSARLRN